MTCPKCAGLLVSFHGDERCMNCGYRQGDLNRQIGSLSNEEEPRECPNCGFESVRKTQHCDHCLQVMANSRKRNKLGRFVEKVA